MAGLETDYGYLLCSALADCADMFMCGASMHMMAFLSASFPLRGTRDLAGTRSEERWGRQRIAQGLLTALRVNLGVETT